MFNMQLRSYTDLRRDDVADLPGRRALDPFCWHQPSGSATG